MDNATAALLGQMVGGVIGVYIMAVLWEFVLFKRVMDDPVRGKFTSAIAGYLTASVVAGFGMADGGPFNPRGFMIYLFGLFVVGFFGVRRGMKLREQAAKDTDLEQTFG